MKSWTWTLLGLASWACGTDSEVQVGGGLFEHLLTPVGGAFQQISSVDTTGGNRDRLEIAPGDSAVILDTEGPAVIERLWITVSSRDPHYLRRIALAMFWDDETDPSVLAPLGDFFGNGFSREHYTSLPLGVSSGGMYSYWPMPFGRRARIVVYNGTDRAIDAFYFNIGLRRGDLPRNHLTFHASWRRTVRTDSAVHHTVLRAVGQGHVVGLSLNAESYTNSLEFLEGDELFMIDGTHRGQGTGTEDYFNGGWYFETGPFAGPLHGLIVKDTDRARIAAYRWHVTDPVPFNDSIQILLEHGHDNADVADYATVVYWYQDEPHALLPPLPAANDRRAFGIKIPPGAVLAGNFSVSGDDSTAVVAVPVGRADRYEVWAYPQGEPNGGTTRLALSGQSGLVVSTASSEPTTVLAPVLLGSLAVPDTVRVTVRPADRALAAVYPKPIRAWATDWHVVGPFHNPQRLGTEYSPAIDLVYDPEDGGDGPYRGVDGRVVEWRATRAGPDGQIRLRLAFAVTDWVVAYGRAYLFSPRAQPGTLLLGADDAHQLWVNGDLVSLRQGRNISRPDDVAIPVQLRAGWNTVLVKVANLDGGWAFQLRAADMNGELQWRASPAR